MPAGQQRRIPPSRRRIHRDRLLRTEAVDVDVAHMGGCGQGLGATVNAGLDTQREAIAERVDLREHLAEGPRQEVKSVRHMPYCGMCVLTRLSTKSACNTSFNFFLGSRPADAAIMRLMATKVTGFMVFITAMCPVSATIT